MQEVFRHIFHFNRPNDSKWRLINAGICILIINVIGYVSGNYSFNAVGSMGVFTFLNYTPTEGSRIMKRLVFVGIVLTISYNLGMLSTLNPWLPPIIIGLIAFFSRLFFRLFQVDKPGDLFAVLCAGAGATRPVTLSEMPQLAFFFICGVALSIIMGYITLRIEDAPKQSTSLNLSLVERIRSHPRSVVDSFNYAISLFFVSYINLALGFGSYSWMMVSASAILQGNTLLQIYSRNFQRIIGTVLGLITAALLLSLSLNITTKIIIIVVFYMIVEYYMPRNYSVAIFFVTNMVMLQMTLATPDIWPELLEARFFGITIGSILGALSATLQYRLYHFYSHTIINERTYDDDFQ
ncbi:FUSC family protein [Aerococcaceae bacterium WGS1372]